MFKIDNIKDVQHNLFSYKDNVKRRKNAVSQYKNKSILSELNLNISNNGNNKNLNLNLSFNMYNFKRRKMKNSNAISIVNTNMLISQHHPDQNHHKGRAASIKTTKNNKSQKNSLQETSVPSLDDQPVNSQDDKHSNGLEENSMPSSLMSNDDNSILDATDSNFGSDNMNLFSPQSISEVDVNQNLLENINLNNDEHIKTAAEMSNKNNFK